MLTMRTSLRYVIRFEFSAAHVMVCRVVYIYTCNGVSCGIYYTCNGVSCGIYIHVMVCRVVYIYICNGVSCGIHIYM